MSKKEEIYTTTNEEIITPDYEREVCYVVEKDKNNDKKEKEDEIT